jgi:hypothetical protein
LIGLVLAATAIFFVPPHVLAVNSASYIDFVIEAPHPDGIAVSWWGGASPLTGLNISVTGIQGDRSDDDFLGITGGLLSFTTGPLTSYDNTSWHFESGGNIALTGGVSALGIASPDTLLLWGSFSEVSVLKVDTRFKVILASSYNELNADVANFFGVSDPYVGSLNLSFFSNESPGQPFTATSLQGGQIEATSVPVPAAFWLFGSGLFGIAALRKRRSV